MSTTSADVDVSCIWLLVLNSASRLVKMPQRHQIVDVLIFSRDGYSIFFLFFLSQPASKPGFPDTEV
jgi:hypothetical protein